MRNKQMQEKTNEMYQEFLKKVKEGDTKLMQGDFHGVLRTSRGSLDHAMFFNTNEIYHTNIMMQFDDDGNESPWILVIVADGEVEEMTEEIAVAEEPMCTCGEGDACNLCKG